LAIVITLPAPEIFTERQYFRNFLKSESFIAERATQYGSRKLFNLKLRQSVAFTLNLLSRVEEVVISFDGISKEFTCIFEGNSIK
jgi:hypothetical protein